MKSLRTIEIQDKKFLVRCDLDVLDETGEIKEYYRLNSSIKTLNYILENGGFAYICGHIGKTSEPNEKFSTKKLLPFFEEKLINKHFELLENLRFDTREEENDESFIKELKRDADYFVNESFATSHRNHSSITGLTKYLPSFLGFHFEEEIENLNYVRENNHHPLVVIIGGVKIESKKPTIDNFLKFSDYILVGGKLSEEKSLQNNSQIILASDSIDGLDIGPATISDFRNYINMAKTIFWSGPLGKVEDERYIIGSKEIADIISKSGAYSVVGGGDTLAFLEKENLIDKFSFVSTGGSSMLEFLSKGTLVGIEAVKNNYGQKNS